MSGQLSGVESVDCPAASPNFEVALLTDIGTNRENNEDACGHWMENADTILFAVADGIGGYEGGEIASRMAIDITLKS
jgi:protein phosphatase